jgi:hypothetical protein
MLDNSQELSSKYGSHLWAYKKVKPSRGPHQTLHCFRPKSTIDPEQQPSNHGRLILDTAAEADIISIEDFVQLVVYGSSKTAREKLENEAMVRAP